MALTDVGQRVVADARAVIRAARAIPVRVQEMKEAIDGTVVLGLSPVSPVSTHHFPAIYQEFHRLHPQVDVSVMEAPSAELVSKLHEELVDIAIMSLPVLGNRVEITPLWQEELVLIDANGSREEDRPGTLIDVRDRPWILFRPGFGLTRTVGALCQTAGFDPKPAAEASSLSAVIGFVASGLGVSIVPREAALEHQRSGRVRIVPIEPMMTRAIALVTASDAELSPAAKAMTATIWQHSRRQQWPAPKSVENPMGVSR